MNYSETIVGFWENKFDTRSKQIKLLDFLTNPQLENIILAIRKPGIDPIEKDMLKAKIRAATISSNCGLGNRRLGCQNNTGLICIDIDQKDNPNIKDPAGVVMY